LWGRAGVRQTGRDSLPFTPGETEKRDAMANKILKDGQLMIRADKREVAMLAWMHVTKDEMKEVIETLTDFFREEATPPFWRTGLLTGQELVVTNLDDELSLEENYGPRGPYRRRGGKA
jgi:hypothetical protein